MSDLEAEHLARLKRLDHTYTLNLIMRLKQKIEKLQDQVYDLKLTLGQAPQEVKKSGALSQAELRSKRIYRTPVPKPSTPEKKKQPRVNQTLANVRKPYTPPKPNVTLERVVSNKVIKQDFDNTWSRASAQTEASQYDDRLGGKPKGDATRRPSAL